MRISAWSSDVCSSDLRTAAVRAAASSITASSSGRSMHSAMTAGCPANTVPATRAPSPAWTGSDRKSVVQGKSVSVRVDLGGRRIITQNTHYTHIRHTTMTYYYTTGHKQTYNHQ